MELGGSRPRDRRPGRQHQGRRARHRHRPLLELRPDVPRRQAHLRLRRGLRRADGAARRGPSPSTSPASAGRRPRSRTSASARCTPPTAAPRSWSSSRTRSTAAASCCSAATTPEGKGYFMQPTIVANPAQDSRVAREETFGPAAAGLAGERPRRGDPAAPTTPSTASARRCGPTTSAIIHRVANEVEAGMKWVNQFHYGYDELPFGGVKQSGYGKEHGMEGLDYYLEDIAGGHRRARVAMAVTFAADGRGRLHHARQAARELLRQGLHGGDGRGGRRRRGRRRRQGRDRPLAPRRSSSARARTSRRSWPTTPPATWR